MKKLFLIPILILLVVAKSHSQILPININPQNSGQGDNLYRAMSKTNFNFNYLDARIDTTSTRLDSLIDAGSGGGTWGSITGTLSNQTDLQTALDGKVATTRTVNGYALSSNVTLVKGDVGLGNVDNTTDLGKPISTLTQTALNGKLGTTLTGHTNITGAFSLGLNHSGDTGFKMNVQADAAQNTAAYYSNSGVRFASFFGSGSFEMNGPTNFNSTFISNLGTAEEFTVVKEDASGNTINFGLTEAPTSGGTTSLEALYFGPSSVDNYSYMKLGDYSAKLGLLNFSGDAGVYLEASTLDEGNLALQVVDTRPVKKGLQAAASGYVTDPLSYTTKEYVDAGVDIGDGTYSLTWDDEAVNAGSFSVTPFTDSRWISYNPGSSEITQIEMLSAGAGFNLSSTGPTGTSLFSFGYGACQFLTGPSSSIAIGIDFNASPTVYAGVNIDGPANNVTINATDVGVSNSLVVSSAGITAADINGGGFEIGGGDIQLSGSSGTKTFSIGTSFEFVGGTLDVVNGTGTLNFPSTAAQSSSDLTITYSGAVTGDMVVLGVPQTAVSANSCYTAWVSSNNTITVRFNNYSSAAIDPASASFKATVIK